MKLVNEEINNTNDQIIWRQISNQIRDQVWDQVRDQVGDQIYNQVGNQIWWQIIYLKDQLGVISNETS